MPALKKYATCKKYLDITLFKKFKVDSGNIAWGNNWEMIFKIEDLYENKLPKVLCAEDGLRVVH